MISVIHLSTSELTGGASRAAYRLHESLRDHEDLTSCMYVAYKSTADPSTVSLPRLQSRFLPLISSSFSLLASSLTCAPEYKSLSLSPLLFPDIHKINSYDIVHLHWIQGEFFPIWFLKRIKRPVVWTLHDLWPILGFQHYPAATKTLSTADLIYHRLKHLFYPRRLAFHCTTEWSLEQLRDKTHLSANPKYCVPYAINTSVFKPRSRDEGRGIFDIPATKTVLLFGAIGGTADPRKGWNLLAEALPTVIQNVPDLHVVVLGQQSNSILDKVIPCSYTAIPHVYDDILLSYIYSMSDITVVPSRYETFGQLASESISCGTPVVAFKSTALAHVVQDMITGLHAEAFSSLSLAMQIICLATNPSLRSILSAQCVNYSNSRWSYSSVSTQLAKMYGDLIL